MIQADFTISPSITGDVFATEFTFEDTTTGGSVFRRVWDFGTGELFYNETAPQYIFKYPGTYNIGFSATDFDGNLSSVTKQVHVDLPYRDYLKFTQIPEDYADPGKKTDVSFKFQVLSTNIDKPLIVDLFAANSKSTPQQHIPSKWNFLTPTWKFLDKNSNFVTSLSVEPVKIYKNDKVVALSGEGEFYYVDSMSTGNPTVYCPILITATLQTSGFNYPYDSSVYPYESHANNESVRSAVVWQVNDLFPTRLKITENYLNPINKKQWEGIKIPVLITCHSNRTDIIPGSKDELSEIIFAYPETNESGSVSEISAKIKVLRANEYMLLESLSGALLQENNFKIILDYPEYIDINPITGNLMEVEDTPLYFQNTDSEGYRTGGYIFTTATILTSTPDAKILLYTKASSNQEPTEDFIYPQGISPNTSVWVSNPEQNALNKITLIPNPGNCTTIDYFKNKKLLVEGAIKEIKVPMLETSNTVNYALSGFSGIYSIAIDPRNYDVIAADAELDRIYKISNTGEILKTYSLSSLNDYDSRKKMFDFWTWKTPSQSLSSTNYLFYNPGFRSKEFKNYIGTIDGLILPTNHLSVIDNDTTIKITAPSGINVPLNRDAYPPQNLDFSVVQIFNPLLPQTYIDSLQYWYFETTTNTLTLPLTGITSLLSDSNRYIVSVNGFHQSPHTYSINTFTRTIEFNESINPNSTVNVHFFGKSLTPAYWEFNLTTSVSALPLTETFNYVKDDQSGFIVSVDGKLLPPTKYTHDTENQRLIFKENLTSGSFISITQITVEENLHVPAAYSPSYVSLDKNYNIWVTLYDSVSVLKFDPELNLLFSTAPKNIKREYRAWVNFPKNIDYQSSLFGFYNRYQTTDETQLEIDNYTDEFFLKPIVGETDRNNNCWVTYTNPLCSMLVKYNTYGKPLLEIPTGEYSTPTGLVVDSSNNVWVANYHGSSYDNTPLSGSLVCYDSQTGQQLQKVTGISRPYHLSIDRTNNLWFSHGQRRIGYYNTKTDILSSWTLDLSGGFSVFTMPTGNLEAFDELENEQESDIGGLAVDVYDRVWVLDGLQNFVWVISASPFFSENEIRYFKARPDNLISYYPDLNDGSVQTKTGDYYFDSLKATGDWTGNRWYQKYITSQSLSSVLLSGVSNGFEVSKFENENELRRINESFNNAEYFEKLALPEILKNNTTLFDKFLPGVVGTGYLSANEDIGQKIYEKIANFNLNHSDIDTCNVKQLLSLAEETQTQYTDFGTELPSEIERLLDIFSVSKSRLWGTKEQKPLLPQSIGNELDTLTYLLTAGMQVVIRNRYDNEVKIIPIPVQNNTEVYPLSTFLGYGLQQPIFSNYFFYEYNPKYSNKYIENIIDWDSEFTSLSPNLSTSEDWFGDGGIVETAFRYILTKNLIVK